MIGTRNELIRIAINKLITNILIVPLLDYIFLLNLSFFRLSWDTATYIYT